MARALHHASFPGESSEYRRDRNRLLQAEVKLRRQIADVAEQRRRLPLGGVVTTDYVFDASDADGSESRRVRLSELFGPGKRTLYIYNFMFPESVGSMTPCPSCTSIIDAIDGAARHLTQRINFAVVAQAPIDRFRAHARSRGWSHALLLSSAGNSFNRDYHAEDETGQQFPLAHVFVRRGKKIHHFWSSELWFVEPEPGQDRRHVDFMWPMWGMFDRTPEGRGKRWGASLEYP
ncbi:MAG TPA: DUF899 family protein [Candidatus Limnocylindrales bacterium]|nr:DUF899 family protein [Candidatus Limnocylindrales bacterium]